MSRWSTPGEAYAYETGYIEGRADAVEVRHGKWQKDEQYTFICSVCGCEAYSDAFGEQKLSAYCPDCGASMDLEGDIDE